jgi:FtsP/CotA-like multicopper oxidase with cupredoxin domain
MGSASRRQILQAGIAVAGGAAWACHRGRLAAARDGGAHPDAELALRATPAEAVLGPGSRPVRVWRYEGRQLAGRTGTFTPAAAGYLGPTIRVRPGDRVRVHFENGLPEDSVVHWHGLDVPEQSDGHPRLAVGPGGSRSYDFEVTARPGTYWYHPHPHGRTGPQVYAGLAGLFIVSDGEDEARGLPSGPFDRPIVIQDRVIGRDGELVYAPSPMLGLLGDRVLVNGVPEATLDVREGTYRLRILNGSNARIYKLGWSDGSPMTVLATDGGLLAAPVTKPYVMLAPGERIDLWADFGRHPSGTRVALESLAFDAGASGMGMGGGMMGGGMMGGGMMGGPRGAGGPANGAALTVCRFSVGGAGTRRPLPKRLDPPAFRPAAEVANPGDPRRFQVSMAMMRWMLNGAPFEMEAVAENERIRRGVTEDWELSNLGGMMAIPHPIHIHGGQFQIVSRAGAEAAAVADGFIDGGWKDTFLLLPGERVRVRVRFDRHAGLFLYHCHNLEHEDMGMMRNFRVE